MQAFPIITNFIIMPLFFLSGALFPVDSFPKVIITVIKLNPLYYGVDALRQTLTGVVQFNLLLDFGVLVVLTLIIMLIGTGLFNRIEV
jgi:ABC-2 type transport system permease protein